MTPAICPGCSRELPGLGRYCEHCEAYTEDMLATTDTTPEARPKPKDTRKEAEIRMGIREALGLYGWDVLDLEQGWRKDGTTRVTKGIADLAVMGYGIFAWLEVKRPSTKQTVDQVAFEERCKGAGVPYHVVRSEDEAVEIMESLKARRDRGMVA